MPLKIIIGVVLIAHGVGHVLGLFPIAGWARADGWSAESWLLTRTIGAGTSELVGLILWVVPMIGFVVAGLGVLGLPIPPEAIRPIALGSALISLVAIALFWDALPAMTSRIGAVVIDIVVVWAVVVGHWPSSDVVQG